MKLGTVKNVKILKPSRDRRTGRMSGLNGLVIEFETPTNLKDGQVVEMIHSDKSLESMSNNRRPTSTFKVKEIEVIGENLLCRAEEYGYWARKLDRDDDLDLRTIIGSDVELIEDTERLSQLRTESCWC